MKVKITCDKCNKQFKQNLQEIEHGDGVKQYFQCPHCKTIYNVCKITSKGLEIRRQIQEAGKDTKLISILQEKLRPEVIRL